MDKIKPFPKIFHVGDGMIPNLFKGEVEITEKIDGSQFAFGIDSDGQIVMRSKGQDLSEQAVPKMFEIAAAQVTGRLKNMFEVMVEQECRDLYFYCEYLEKPHHNTLTYSRVPKNNLYLFGVYSKGEWVSDYDMLYVWADDLDIERPNLLHTGEIADPVSEIEHLLHVDSILGNTKIEGVVVKNYNEPAFKGSYVLPISMGKYVSEKFKEKHNKEWKKTSGKGKLELLIESFKTEARWEKAIQHLRDNDELENAPKDIGKLIKEIQRDLEDEEKEYAKG
ncbi:unnamed protein product, partial [marine sediment metagenome]